MLGRRCIKRKALDALAREKDAARLTAERTQVSLSEDLKRIQQDNFNAIQKIQSLNDMYKRLQEYSTSLQQYNSRLQSELNSTNENIKRIEMKKIAAVEGLSTLRGHNSSLQEQLTYSRATQDEAVKHKNAFSSEVACLRVDLQQVREERDRQFSRAEAASAEIENYREQTKECTAMLDSLHSRTKELEVFPRISFLQLTSWIIENELIKQDLRSRKKIEIFQYIFLKWTLALLIGLFTGFVGFFNNLAVENIAGFKLLLTSNYMLEDKYFQAFAVFAGLNAILATCAAVLCAYIAPAGAGSGIPEVKAYLNGVDAHSILAPSTLFVKIFGSIFGVSAGFVVGKEGPMVHTGACIANLLGQGGSRKYRLTWKWLRYFKNDRDRRDLITCGAAAGVAAAFRAPVGGVLFALEEAASWWRGALLWRTFFTTAVVAVVLRSLMQFCRSGKCGLFGQGGLIMFDVNSVVPAYNTPDLFAVMFIGVLGGFLGSLYNYLVDKVLRIYSIINERGPAFKILLVITISLLTSCCAYGLPWFAQCTPCPPGSDSECPTVGRSGSYKNFQCQPGQYNDLASLLLNTNDDAIRNLFSSKNGNELHISTLLVFFVIIYFLGIVTYGIAVPSGLFIPVILAGASYGRLVGRLLGSVSSLGVGLFALLGAASFLGGTMRMTVSLCVILLELTNDLLMLPLMMLVLLISKTVADCFNKGVYDQIVKMKGLPFMESHAEPYMRHLVAGDVCSGPLISFTGVEKVANIVHALQMTRHNAFPVTDDPPFVAAPELCGLALRSHLLVLLKGKRFTKNRVLFGSEILRTFHAFDFAKAGSGKGLKVEDLDLSEEEMEMYVDLHPIINTSPYTVVETMSLAKAAVLFRQLGLRHLCVVPKTPGRPPIVGILTRHDFMPEHVLGLYPQFIRHK